MVSVLGKRAAGRLVLLCDVGLECVPGGAEFTTVGAGEATRAEVLSLDMIRDCGGIGGGVAAVSTPVQPAAVTQYFGFYGFV